MGCPLGPLAEHNWLVGFVAHHKYSLSTLACPSLSVWSPASTACCSSSCISTSLSTGHGFLKASKSQARGILSMFPGSVAFRVISHVLQQGTPIWIKPSLDPFPVSTAFPPPQPFQSHTLLAPAHPSWQGLSVPSAYCPFPLSTGPTLAETGCYYITLIIDPVARRGGGEEVCA